MPRKPTKRSSAPRSPRKQKQVPAEESFLLKMLVGAWKLFVAFLKMYIPANPKPQSGQKKQRTQRKRRYVASKRT